MFDKIKAEIEQNAYPIIHGVNNHEKGMTLYGILQVLDKYAEQEPTIPCDLCGFNTGEFCEYLSDCPATGKAVSKWTTD